MNKKIALLLGVACSVGVCLSSFTACGDGKPVHEHTLFDFEAVEATCVSEGNVAYKECLYCRKKVVNGKEVSDDEIKLAVNPDNHKALQDIPVKAAKCYEQGEKAHSECADCHKIFIDGNPVTQEDVVIPALGSHSWAESGTECEFCDAYKLLADGEYYTVDANNRHMIEKTADLSPSYAGTVATKKPYLEDGYYLSHRMQFAAQVADTAKNIVENADGNWKITNSDTTNSNSFTRFAYGTGSTGYIGRFIMTYDFTVSAEATIDRIGVKVVDKAATAINADYQSKLLGVNAAEENNAERTLTPNTVYTFSYLLELTAQDQLVQIFNCIKGVQTSTVSNLHFVNLEGGETGIAGARMLYFGDGSDKIVVKSECAHSYSYDVAAAEATCQSVGWIEHNHCPVCGLNKVNGSAYEGEVKLDIVPHAAEQVPAKTATCSEAGYAAHYKCNSCGKRFADADCTQDITDSYLISAEHKLESRSAKDPDCTTDGNIAHWQCTVCNKTFADETAAKELTADQIRLRASHEFANGLCSKCGVNEIVSIGEKAFATTGTEMYPALLANAGKWGCQTQASGVTAKIENNVLYATVSQNATANKNKAFIRVIPAKDGAEFVGSYELTFEFTVTKALGSASKTSLQVGYFIKAYDAETGKDVTKAQIADVATTFEVGKKYRFTVSAESLNQGECLQFNVRNTANSGAEFEITNAKFTFKDASENTGSYQLKNVMFAQLV